MERNRKYEQTIHKNGNRNYNQKTSDKQKPRARCLQRLILSNIQQRTKTYPQTFPKTCRRRNTPKNHYHPDNKTSQKYYKKRILQVSITDEYRCKNLEKNQRIECNNKRIIHHDQAGFNPGTQGFLNIHKPINVKHYINN